MDWISGVILTILVILVWRLMNSIAELQKEVQRLSLTSMIDVDKLKTFIRETRKADRRFRKGLYRLEVSTMQNVREVYYLQTRLAVNDRKVDRILMQIRRLANLYRVLPRLEESMKKIIRVTSGVCKQFVVDSISQTALRGINLGDFTDFPDFVDIETIRRSNRYCKIDHPKDIKGDVGELLVLKILQEKMSWLDVTRIGELDSSPDFEIRFKNTKVCLEVKDHHKGVDRINVAKFEGYMQRDEFDYGILVNIGQGGIEGYSSRFQIVEISGKPCILLSELCYNLSPLIGAISLLEASIR